MPSLEPEPGSALDAEGHAIRGDVAGRIDPEHYRRACGFNRAHWDAHGGHQKSCNRCNYCRPHPSTIDIARFCLVVEHEYPHSPKGGEQCVSNWLTTRKGGGDQPEAGPPKRHLSSFEMIRGRIRAEGTGRKPVPSKRGSGCRAG